MGDQISHSPPDFYKILSIPRDASLQDIRKAYKSLVRRWHPDKHPASDRNEAEIKCKAINEAYEALTSDKETRSMYGIYYSKENHWEDDFFGFTYDPGSPSKVEKPHSVDDLIGKSDHHHPPRSKSSKRSNIPTHSSYSGVRRKPPPIERKLECTLEELCHGCVKKIMVTRDVLTSNRTVSREEELVRIKVKPGWKKGTRITFEGMGDEKPNSLTSDLVFVIAEKQHPLFKRDGNDLVFAREIPLVKALTGTTLSIPLLGGEKMSCTFKEIIYPGYEKVIKGQGMPDLKEQGKRGDLRVKFYVEFPSHLSEEQRKDIRNLLQQVYS